MPERLKRLCAGSGRWTEWSAVPVLPPPDQGFLSTENWAGSRKTKPEELEASAPVPVARELTAHPGESTAEWEAREEGDHFELAMPLAC